VWGIFVGKKTANARAGKISSNPVRSCEIISVYPNAGQSHVLNFQFLFIGATDYIPGAPINGQ
jgi:hypothetical protein